MITQEATAVGPQHALGLSRAGQQLYEGNQGRRLWKAPSDPFGIESAPGFKYVKGLSAAPAGTELAFHSDFMQSFPTRLAHRSV